jgi:membrane protease subunit (stomatin/prohibitin family)
VISNGSKILVPENTAAFIFSQGGVEEIVTTPGGYEYFAGQASVFDGDGIMESIVRQTAERFTFGGQTPDQTWVAFVNLREIRGLRFGTRAPMVYHDRFYSADLEIIGLRNVLGTSRRRSRLRQELPSRKHSVLRVRQR